MLGVGRAVYRVSTETYPSWISALREHLLNAGLVEVMALREKHRVVAQPANPVKRSRTVSNMGRRLAH